MGDPYDPNSSKRMASCEAPNEMERDSRGFPIVVEDEDKFEEAVGFGGDESGSSPDPESESAS